MGDMTVRQMIEMVASDQAIPIEETDVREIIENVVMYVSQQVFAMGFVIEHPERG